MKSKFFISILFVFILLFSSTGTGLVFAERSTTYEEVFSDLKISWIRGYVTVTYDDNDKIIGTPTTDSELYGFHPFNVWKHSSGRSTVNIDKDRKGGYANISGDLTFSVTPGVGVGDLATKEISGVIWF